VLTRTLRNVAFIERGLMLLVLTAAHFSQFIFNVPVLKTESVRVRAIGT